MKISKIELAQPRAMRQMRVVATVVSAITCAGQAGAAAPPREIGLTLQHNF